MSLDPQPHDYAERAARAPAAPSEVLGPTVSGAEMAPKASAPKTPTSTTADLDAEIREAILAPLYDERSALLRKRRLNGLNEDENSRLADLEAYIDDFELREEEERTTEIWKQIDDLAARVLASGFRR